jgi:hypothetical protein
MHTAAVRRKLNTNHTYSAFPWPCTSMLLKIKPIKKCFHYRY